MILAFNIQNYFLSVYRFVGKEDSGFSLNSRTYIWAYALQIIKHKPLFGIGNLSESDILNFVLYGASHPHNIFLELLVRAGVIGTISYLFFLLYPLIRYNRYYIRSNYAILSITVFSYLVLSFMDFYPLIQAPIFLVSYIYIRADNINNNFYLDLSDILWENIVLEIPIKVVKEGVHLETSSGKGWSVEEN